jgi:peptidoglycan/LPS O-acetylase OafA/YrhL
MVFSFHMLDYVPVDGVRAPLLFHWATMGAFGVPIFFLLSAFLITELLLKELTETSQIHVKAFYLRRILRIWPLYFVIFIGLTLLNRLLPGVGPTTKTSWVAFLLFAGNWYITRYGWIAGAVDPLWSISVEEQFYLLIPLVIAVGRRTALAVVSVLFLLIAYISIWQYAQHPSVGDNGEWTNSFVQFQFFAAGTLIALSLRGRLPNIPNLIRIIVGAFAFFCWSVALRFGVKSWDAHPSRSGAIFGWLFALVGCTLIFLCVFGWKGGKIPKSWIYLGRISYGLYIFHSLVFHLVFVNGSGILATLSHSFALSRSLSDAIGVAVVLAGTLIVAHLSYQYFEMPFLKIKQQFTFLASNDPNNPVTKKKSCHSRLEGTAQGAG